MRLPIVFLTATVLFLAVPDARPQSSDEQPAIPHAHYGRDGFWHCDEGYATGESGACEAVASGSASSTYTRLREFERSGQAREQQAARATDDAASADSK